MVAPAKGVDVFGEIVIGNANLVTSKGLTTIASMFHGTAILTKWDFMDTEGESWGSPNSTVFSSLRLLNPRISKEKSLLEKSKIKELFSSFTICSCTGCHV